MAKLTRKNQKIFGASAPSGQIRQFGSEAEGVPLTTTDPETIQALATRYDVGLQSALAAAGSGYSLPLIEDYNALFYLISYQLFYQFEAGIPEYNALTTYYIGSYVREDSNIYVSKVDSNTGNLPSTDGGTNWTLFVGFDESDGNFGLGTDNPLTELQVDSQSGVTEVGIYSHGAGSFLTIGRSQGTQDSPTTIGNGQELGRINFDGYTGSLYRTGAAIYVDVTSGVSGDEIPSSIFFATTADGATSPTDRMVIDENGNVEVNGVITAKASNSRFRLFGSTTDFLLQNVDSDGRFRIYNDTTDSEDFTLLPDGKVGIGTSPSYLLDAAKATSGSDNTAAIRNTSNTASSDAVHLIEVAGASAGNPLVRWRVAGLQAFYGGMDNDDGDKWKLATSSDLSSPAITVRPSDNRVTFGDDIEVFNDTNTVGAGPTINLDADDSGGSVSTYGQLRLEITDNTAGSEKADLSMWTARGTGSLFRTLTAYDNGDVGINLQGNYQTTANGGGVLLFGDNGATDPTLQSNTAGFFGKDVAGTIEMFAIDEAGNATQLSSHDPESGEWRFYSRNTKTGREVEVDLEGFFKHYDEKNGTSFFKENIPLK